MKHYIVPALLAALVVMGVARAQEPAAPAAPAATAPKFAFVDVKRVLREYTKTRQINQQLRAAQSAGDQRVLALRTELRGLQEEIESAKSNALKHRALKRDFERLKSKIEFERKWAESSLADEMARATLEVYGDLTKVLDGLRARDGYTAIFKRETGPITGADTGLEVNLRINTRAVVASDPALDITEAVIAQLNGK